MKKLFFFLSFILSFGIAHTQIFSPSSIWGIHQARGAYDSVLYFPTGCGAPTDTSFLRSYGFVNNGQRLNMWAVYGDSCNNKVWFWNPSTKSWIGVGANILDTTSLSTRINSKVTNIGGMNFWGTGITSMRPSPTVGPGMFYNTDSSWFQYTDGSTWSNVPKPSGSGGGFTLSDTGYTHLLASPALLQKTIDSMKVVNDARYRTILDTTYAHLLMSRNGGYKIVDSLAADYISRLLTKRDITDTSFAHLLMTRAWGYKISDSIFAVINLALATKQAQLNGTGYVKVLSTTVSYQNNTQLTADVNTFTPSLKGVVPAPGGSPSGANVLADNGTWIPNGGGSSPGGADGDIQYKNSSAFNGNASLHWNNSSKILSADSTHIKYLQIDVAATQPVATHLTSTRTSGFWESLDQSGIANDGAPDDVHGYDLYNMISDGTAIDPHFPAFGLFTETHWHQGGKQMEHHMVFIDSNALSRRLESLLINEESGFAYQYWTKGAFDIFGTDQTKDPYFSINENAIASIVGAGQTRLNIEDSTAGGGNFKINAEDDGSVIIINDHGVGNAVIDFKNPLITESLNPSVPALTISMPNVDALAGATFTGTVDGTAYPITESVSAGAGLINKLENIGAGYNILWILGTTDVGMEFTNGSDNWVYHIDNSDSNKMKIGVGSGYKTSPHIALNTAGNVMIGTPTDNGTNAKLQVHGTISVDNIDSLNTPQNSLWVGNDGLLHKAAVSAASSDGIYVPTITNSSNAGSIVSDSAVWSRTGNTVTVDGSFAVSPISGAVNTQVIIAIPVNSNLLSGRAAWGTSMTQQTANGGIGGAIFSTGLANQVELTFYPTLTTTSITVYYHYGYRVY